MAAGLLARAGRRVAVAERETFPRFHIGESMLPQSLSVLERAGALDAVRAAGFVRKDGAVFLSADGSKVARFDFSAASPASGHPHAFQVDRATFDAILLDWAVAQGATLLARCDAIDVRGRNGGEHASVGLGDRRVSARFVVDACGLDSTSGRLRGWHRDPLVKDRVGLFGHFRLAQPAIAGVPSAVPGDILIVENSGAWSWFIPLRDGITSVGFVLTATEFGELAGTSHEERFDAMAATMPAVAARLAGAERLSPIRGARSYGRSNATLVDDGVVLAGDAAGFLDPVFSSGICLALNAAECAARAIGASLTDPAREQAEMDAYVAQVRRGFASMAPFVTHWYDGSLKRVFFHPNRQPHVIAWITSILAGELWRDDNPILRDGSGWIRSVDRLITEPVPRTA